MVEHKTIGASVKNERFRYTRVADPAPAFSMRFSVPKAVP